MTQIKTRVGKPPIAKEVERLRPWMVAAMIFMGFLVFRFRSVDQLPVWDGAMGMMPAALTLESMDFDLARLLQQPDYMSGGPNAHPMSIVTWFTGLAIRLFGSLQAAIPALHLVSFILVGILGAGVFRAVNVGTSNKNLAFIAAVSAVIFPPMVVQASDIYLDLPLAVAVTWAFVYAFESRFSSAIILLVVAAAIKPTALVAIPPMAFYFWKTAYRRRNALAMLVFPAAIAVTPFLVLGTVVRPSPEVAPSEALSTFAFTTSMFSRMPVLVGFLLVVAVLPYFVNRRGTGDHRQSAMLMCGLFLPISFIYFFLLNPLVSRGYPALPRYTTLFLPLAVISFCISLSLIAKRRVVLSSGLAVVCVFALNLHGGLEPSSSNEFWTAQRSLKYEQMLEVQEEAFHAFAAHARSMPGIYDHFAHYRIEYPETGWVPEGGVPSGLDAYGRTDLSGHSLPELPDQFVMLIENQWLGGARLADIRDTALASPDYTVDIEEVRRGEFSNQVIVVTRLSQTGVPGY